MITVDCKRTPLCIQPSLKCLHASISVVLAMFCNALLKLSAVSVEFEERAVTTTRTVPSCFSFLKLLRNKVFPIFCFYPLERAKFGCCQ